METPASTDRVIPFRKAEKMHRHFCDGTRRFSSGTETYHQAYDRIFLREGGRKNGDKYLHTRSSIKYLTQLNHCYLSEPCIIAFIQQEHTRKVISEQKEKDRLDAEREASAKMIGEAKP